MLYRQNPHLCSQHIKAGEHDVGLLQAARRRCRLCCRIEAGLHLLALHWAGLSLQSGFLLWQPVSKL